MCFCCLPRSTTDRVCMSEQYTTPFRRAQPSIPWPICCTKQEGIHGSSFSSYSNRKLTRASLVSRFCPAQLLVKIPVQVSGVYILRARRPFGYSVRAHPVHWQLHQVGRGRGSAVSSRTNCMVFPSTTSSSKALLACPVAAPLHQPGFSAYRRSTQILV